MTDIQSLRQQLVSAIAELPPEALVELVSFVDYQRYKSFHRARTLLDQPSPIKPEMLVESSIAQLESPLYEQLSPQELAQAFLVWVESHEPNTSRLSDYAVSRESMYEDEVY
ncbi:MAG: hypothetical protein HC936_06000 [Leptolyngbyaceae cyanobacterium SU_3_3]|nr:hypothetical protein [Leptolyngbyaceae cyanobacterium SU_3_3]